MDTPTTLQERLARFFVQRLHVEIPSFDTDLFETGLIDSLGFVELLHHLEEEFGVTVSLEDVDLDTFRSIERIAEFLVQAHQASRTT